MLLSRWGESISAKWFEKFVVFLFVIAGLFRCGYANTGPGLRLDSEEQTSRASFCPAVVAGTNQDVQARRGVFIVSRTGRMDGHRIPRPVDVMGPLCLPIKSQLSFETSLQDQNRPMRRIGWSIPTNQWSTNTHTLPNRFQTSESLIGWHNFGTIGRREDSRRLLENLDPSRAK